MMNVEKSRRHRMHTSEYTRTIGWKVDAFKTLSEDNRHAIMNRCKSVSVLEGTPTS